MKTKLIKLFSPFAVILILFSFNSCSVTQTIEYETSSEIANPEDSVESVENRFQLLASAADDDTFLYGIHPSGVVLYIGDNGYYYDWNYKSTETNSSEIFVGDFDNDTSREILIFGYLSSDNETNTNHLYLIDPENPTEPNDIDLSVINDETNKEVTYTPHAEGITFSIENQNFSFDLSESYSQYIFKTVSYNDEIVFFEDNDNIYINIVPVVKSGDDENDYGSASVAMTITARVAIIDNVITLFDFSAKGL